LEDEPYAEWALGPREALEALRHEARIALAMDRSRGYGRSTLAEVVQAWEVGFRADPSSEEAACALIRAYSAQGRHTLSRTTYDRLSPGSRRTGPPPLVQAWTRRCWGTCKRCPRGGGRGSRGARRDSQLHFGRGYRCSFRRSRGSRGRPREGCARRLARRTVCTILSYSAVVNGALARLLWEAGLLVLFQSSPWRTNE
jgi:hypothetical protein